MTIKNTERPLVTFALFAYNQERFIREAVEAALAQTYSPLEVILSDDCSSDRTFEIMSECVKEYAGDHRVVLNRNAQNLGVAEHVNTIMRLAKGDLIVLAAGDDISRPERTSVLALYWLANGEPVAMCSSFVSVDEQGVPHGDSEEWYRNFMPREGETDDEILERLIRHGVPALIGCTEACSRRLFSEFPPLNADVWFEDNALSFRAWLIDEIHYLSERLVAYRQHGNNISNHVGQAVAKMEDIVSAEKKKAIWYARRRAVLAMHQSDLDVALANGFLNIDMYTTLSRLIAREMTLLEVRSGWWQAKAILRPLNAVRMLTKDMSWASIRWALPRLLPLCWFARIQLRRANS